jgi:quinoprotein glucose dehydrogenase
VRADAPLGPGRGFAARSGALKWSWDPVPRDPRDPATASWGEGWKTAGEANVWAPMSADSARGLVFLPTSSPSPDFYGGLRPGNNAHANSVVALEGATGALRWAYQLVHHDVWDYDTPAQPTLATLDLAQGKRDVVIQATKQGFVFVLDRDTGQPVFPVQERPVPQGGAAGERLSPTQPFPSHIPPLVPQELAPADAFGLTPFDRAACRDAIAAARNEGLYTPPSEQGTLVFPMTGGGVNWGGVAFDPVKQILYANTNRVAQLVTLFRAARFEELHGRYPHREVSPQHGAPFGMIRDLVFSPIGMPCSPPPWGAIAALDLAAGKILWESTLGTTEAVAPLGLALRLGMPGFGGPLVTAGGVVFIGAAADFYLRAFDAASGKELWQGRLPASAQSTPMTFQLGERQYVVIAAGGHAELGTAPGDSIVAFALPGEGEAGPTLWSRTVDRPGGRFVVKVIIIAIAAWSLIWLALRQVRKRRLRR